MPCGEKYETKIDPWLKRILPGGKYEDSQVQINHVLLPSGSKPVEK